MCVFIDTAQPAIPIPCSSAITSRSRPCTAGIPRCSLMTVLATDAAGSRWVHAVAPTALRLVFQNLLHEQDDAVKEGSQALWSTLLQRLGAASSVDAMPADTLEVISWSDMPFTSTNLLTRPPQLRCHHARRTRCRMFCPLAVHISDLHTDCAGADRPERDAVRTAPQAGPPVGGASSTAAAARERCGSEGGRGPAGRRRRGPRHSGGTGWLAGRRGGGAGRPGAAGRSAGSRTAGLHVQIRSDRFPWHLCTSDGTQAQLAAHVAGTSPPCYICSDAELVGGQSECIKESVS